MITKTTKMHSNDYQLFIKSLSEYGGEVIGNPIIVGNTATVVFRVDNYTQFWRYWQMVNNNITIPIKWYTQIWNKIINWIQ